MDRAAAQAWIADYERAWRTPSGAALDEALAGLFAPEASYRMAPFEKPHLGLPAITALWDAEREGPDEIFAMDAEVLAIEGDVGVAQVEVHYGEPLGKFYRDLWVMRFDDAGRCLAFDEWPFAPPESGGTLGHRPQGGEAEAERL